MVISTDVSSDVGTAGRQRGSTEGAIDAIRRRIVSAGLGSGDRLPTQRALARQSGMSPMVIREALRELQAQHVIEARRGDGLYVKLYGPELAESALRPEQDTSRAREHLCQARAAVEVAAAEEACREATEDDLAKLQEIVEAMGASARRGVYRSALDLQFHKTLVGAAHNPFFIRFGAVVAEYFVVRGAQPPPDPGPAMARIEAHHRAMLAILRRRDPRDVGAAVRLHVRDELWRPDWKAHQHAASADAPDSTARPPERSDA